MYILFPGWAPCCAKLPRAFGIQQALLEDMVGQFVGFSLYDADDADCSPLWQAMFGRAAFLSKMAWLSIWRYLRSKWCEETSIILHLVLSGACIWKSFDSWAIGWTARKFHAPVGTSTFALKESIPNLRQSTSKDWHRDLLQFFEMHWRGKPRKPPPSWINLRLKQCWQMTCFLLESGRLKLNGVGNHPLI